MKIDSHQHYWLTSRTDYGWLQPSVKRLYADYMPEDLKPLLKSHGIDRTIIVQAAPTVAETEFMLGIAREEETVAGVVGWVDLTAPDFEQVWLRLREDPYFVGIRPMIQDLPSEWILQDIVVKNLRVLADAQFPLDLQANMRHLPFLVQLLEQIPHLRAVVDHLAKPNIPSGALEPWGTQMEQLASFPNVMCKLSGMVPGTLDEPWTNEGIQPFALRAIEAFGRKRVMFGSDWPVCTLSATYDQTVGLFEACLTGDWSEEERADVYGGNAARFYGIKV
ncbi:amidohydrolase family protein [Paenibacillus mendelii]|uniref:Amidohydrolase family protein n=1 Tax=Paenibacillus mendelii TaxID=206163 RepID=A0ABV6J6S0_9BACL|nr:amidohydrolase family protein [Paenibacillus mendelii]MCQ6561050.1 amidohydrolase family protein [Paenibacillus mendelii]